jgi:hypothetical protein
MRSSQSFDRLGTAFDDDRLVAEAGLLLPAAGAAQERRELVLDGSLEDEPRAQPAELSEPVGLLEPMEQSGLDRGLDLDAGAILRSTAWSPLRTS